MTLKEILKAHLPNVPEGKINVLVRRLEEYIAGEKK